VFADIWKNLGTRSIDVFVSQKYQPCSPSTKLRNSFGKEKDLEQKRQTNPVMSQCLRSFMNKTMESIISYQPA